MHLENWQQDHYIERRGEWRVNVLIKFCSWTTVQRDYSKCTYKILQLDHRKSHYWTTIQCVESTLTQKILQLGHHESYNWTTIVSVEYMNLENFAA